jgi:hypothetical protein
VRLVVGTVPARGVVPWTWPRTSQKLLRDGGGRASGAGGKWRCSAGRVRSISASACLGGHSRAVRPGQHRDVRAAIVSAVRPRLADPVAQRILTEAAGSSSPGSTRWQLWRIAKNLSIALAGIFGAAAGQAGAPDIGEKLTARFATWTQSSQGSQQLPQTFALPAQVAQT